MTISGSTPSPALAVLTDKSSASNLQAEVAVRLLKKVNDQTQQQGAALISMLEQVGAPARSGEFHLDTYA